MKLLERLVLLASAGLLSSASESELPARTGLLGAALDKSGPSTGLSVIPARVQEASGKANYIYDSPAQHARDFKKKKRNKTC